MKLIPIPTSNVTVPRSYQVAIVDAWWLVKEESK